MLTSSLQLKPPPRQLASPSPPDPLPTFPGLMALSMLLLEEPGLMSGAKAKRAAAALARAAALACR